MILKRGAVKINGWMLKEKRSKILTKMIDFIYDIYYVFLRLM